MNFTEITSLADLSLKLVPQIMKVHRHEPGLFQRREPYSLPEVLPSQRITAGTGEDRRLGACEKDGQKQPTRLDVSAFPGR